MKNVTIGHLNINSLRNKIEALKDVITQTFDIFFVSETKIDASFPNNQFCIPGYKMFRKDRNCYGGGLCFYINDNMFCKQLNEHDMPTDIEAIFLEIKIKTRKWLFIGAYKPPNQSEEYFLNNISNCLTSYLEKFDNVLILGDLNMVPENKKLQTFLDSYSIENLIKEPTCFKGKPSLIDVMITNHKNYFKSTCLVDTGISDFHKLTAASMKTYLAKGPPRIQLYRDYKNFDKNCFKNDLKEKINSIKNRDYSIFEATFLKVLNFHAPLKQKVLRANHNAFMTKALRKAIMRRSCLKNKYIKNRTNENWNTYKAQKNFCTNLLRKTKRNYFSNLNLKKICDNKTFWKKVKPYFSEKGIPTNKISLVENNKPISDEQEISKIFNKYFVNMTKSLNLKQVSLKTSNINSIIANFSNHISILKIRSRNISSEEFYFKKVSEQEVQKVILELNPKKSALSGCLPVDILQENIDIYLKILTDIINETFVTCSFPNELKLAEIIPIFKKKDALDKQNYRPISLLSYMSKILERIIHNQINDYIEPYFSNLLTGFRKNHNTQNSLLNMIEKWKEFLDKGKYVNVIIMDLSKAFDTINHYLLTAKLYEYGFSHNSMQFILSYLQNRTQRTNVNYKFSLWEKITSGVPQGSILGPLLFNIYINDIFLFTENSFLSNYADDSTLYTTDVDLQNANNKIRVDFLILQNWFYENFMVLNTDKCHFMCFGNSVEYKQDLMITSNSNIPYTEQQELLGITIDSKSNFDLHIKFLCKKVGQKLNALSRVSPFLKDEQKKVLYNSFFRGQFNYCPLIWTFCSRYSNNLINRLHERALRLATNNYEDNFDMILSSAKESTIHEKNIQTLLIEVYKFLNNLSPPIMSEIFSLRQSNYNLRKHRELQTERKNTIKYGTDSIIYKSTQIWGNLPQLYKNIPSLNIFKKNIKTITNNLCQCKLCRNYVANVGYID